MAKLSVHANPYSAFDHLGRPCGAVLCDPVEHVRYEDPHADDPKNPHFQERRYVGAQLDRDKCKAGKRNGHLHIADNENTEWCHSSDVVELPETNYYKERVRDGELIPGDAETAKLCGVPFVEPKLALANAKKKLAELWTTSYPNEPLPEWAKPTLTLVKDAQKEVA